MFQSIFFRSTMEVPKIRSKQNGRNRKENPIPCVDIETEKSSSGTLKSSEKSTHQRCVFTIFSILKLVHELFKKSYTDVFHYCRMYFDDRS